MRTRNVMTLRTACFTAWVAATAALVTGCDSGTQSQTQSDASPPEAPAATVETIIAQDTSSPGVYSASNGPSAAHQSIASVNSVMLGFPAGNARGLIIRASGVVPDGWNNPALIAVEDKEPLSTVKTYRFVAEAESKAGNIPSQPVYVELLVDDFPSDVTTVRIESATNALSAVVVRPTTIAGNGRQATR
jgi:hypothetical protein